MNRKIIILYVVLLLSSSIDASSHDRWIVSGFGTIGGAYNDNSDVVYHTSYLTDKGSDSQFSLATDTKLGLQLDINLAENLDFVLQSIAYNSYKRDIDVGIEWANIKYDFNDNFSLRIGRQLMPIFLYSNILNVSYAYPWTRLPSEVYIPIVFTSIDGISLRNIHFWDEFTFVTHLFYGDTKNVDLIRGGIHVDAKSKDIKCITLQTNYKSFGFNFSYVSTNQTMASEFSKQFPILLTQSGFADLADKYNMNKSSTVEFMSLGLSYENSNLLLNGEYFKTDTATIFDNYEGWYINCAYQYKKFMPYIKVGRTKQSVYPENSIPNSGMTAPFRQGIDMYLLAAGTKQKSQTIGLRYDLLDNAAVKIQYEHIELDDKINSFYTHKIPQPGDMNVISLTLDFVF